MAQEPTPAGRGRFLLTVVTLVTLPALVPAIACGGDSGDSGGGANNASSSNGGTPPPGSSNGSSGVPPVPPMSPDGGVVVNYTCTRKIHLSPTGDDSADGSENTPKKTISKATLNAMPGDCIVAHKGTYTETSRIEFNNDGTQAAPIVLWSIDGRGAAIIDEAGNANDPGVLVRNDYVVIDGFDFKNMPTDNEQVVHFDGINGGGQTGKGVGTVLRNSRITGGYDHIKINQAAQGVLVEYNEFYGNFAHLPVSLTGAPGLVFRGNYCHDWDTGDNGAVQIKGGSHDVIFDGNRFENVTSNSGTIAMGDGCDSTCDIDPDHYAAVRVRAINNTMKNVGRGFDIQGCKDCAVINNTIVESSSNNVTFKLTSASTNGNSRTTVNARIFNNLVVSTKGDMGNFEQINPGNDTGLQEDYNLFYNAGQATDWGDGHPASADTHSLTVDPKLTSIATGDYTLLPGSPAIKAGTNLINDVPHDYVGAARPATGPFDIGAFQTP